MFHGCHSYRGYHGRGHDERRESARGEGHRFSHGVFGRSRHGHHGSHRGGSRFFDQGDLRLVILRLIAERPRHGYEIIKEIEDRLAGAYSPSPGVIYPTLTLLEELGLAAVTPQDGGKKLYAITPEGEQHLAEKRADADRIFARMEAARAELPAGSTLQVIRAMYNLKNALRMRMTRGGLDQAALGRIIADIDELARRIERS